MLLTSLASRFTELPRRVIVPPSTVANERGSNTFEGEMRRRWHQPSITGNRLATIGVFGTKADTGPTAATITAIIRLGLRTASEPIRARSRSRPPLRNRPAERANSPISVIRAGLPNPSTASEGLSTPVTISSAAASRPVSSGANQPPMNSTIEPASTSKVIKAPGCSTAESRSATGIDQIGAA